VADRKQGGAGQVQAFALPGADAAIFRQDIAGCLDAVVGAGGLTSAQLSGWLEKVDAALVRLKTERARGAIPSFKLADESDVVDMVAAAYARLSADAGTVIFLGAGGASLGAQAIAQFGGWGIPGTTTPEQRQRPATRFYDNLDAETLGALLSAPKLERFRFIVVSTSGRSPDVLAQAIAALAAVRAAGLEARIPELFLGITEPAVAGRRNGLRDLLGHYGVPILDHPPGIAGGYGALATAGLMAAVARGLDARQVLQGAAAVVRHLEQVESASELPAATGAAVLMGLTEAAGIRAHVMMPYSDRLMRFAHWYVQLCGASLGKDGKGVTPIACGGPVDQYGLLQAFLDGPREHVVTVLRAPGMDTGPLVPPDLARMAGLDEMAGRRVGELVAVEADVAAAALRAASRPVRTIELVRYDAIGLGALLMHFMIEVILTGYVMGVDPFDQPAAELSKRLTRERLAAAR
jgi:glucose-6-phosphate isomerase